MNDGEREGARLQDARKAGNEENVVAIVGDTIIKSLPTDLYIPPDALEVFLGAFEGPMDLLLYLIRRRNLDILEISVSEVTDQYMRYIEMMTAMKLTLAGEYLAMAATLAEIKSRLLLPRTETVEEEEEDPRAELVRRLREYERFKAAAADLEALPRLERDIQPAAAALPTLIERKIEPMVEMKDLLLAMADILHRAALNERHAVAMETLSVRERMSLVLTAVNSRRGFVPFTDLFDVEEGKQGVIVTFLALMELSREGVIEIVQRGFRAPIYVRAGT